MCYLLRIYLFTLFLLFTSFCCLCKGENTCAKDSVNIDVFKHTWNIGGQIGTGFFWAHKSTMKDMPERQPYVLEIFFENQTTGNRGWSSFFNYPEYGLAFQFLSPGSPDYVGNAYCLFPYIHFSFLNQRQPINLGMRIGVGIGYIEKIYNPNAFYQNIAISTHLNATLAFGFDVSYAVSERLLLRTGVGLTHLSNGSYKKPNLGINVINAMLSMSYAFGETNPLFPKRHSFMDENPKHLQLECFILGGIRENGIHEGIKYGAGGLSLLLSYKHLEYTRFGGGFDLSYDRSDYTEIVNRTQEKLSYYEAVKPGIFVSYEFLFGQFSALAQCALYLYNRNAESLGYTYQRLAVHYSATNKLKFHLGLKNHLNVADYIEFGIGYKLF